MKAIGKFRKRPCRICRKWFVPDPRPGDRQKTCGEAECKRKWHNKKCADWNKKNQPYFRAIYLSAKLEHISDSISSPGPPASLAASPIIKISKVLSEPRFNLKLPRDKVQEVMGTQQLVIIEYVAQVLWGRFQEVIQAQRVEIKRDPERLLPMAFSRSDSRERAP